MKDSRNDDHKRVLDDGDANADWPKRTYDLGFTTLSELADFLGFHPASKDFKRWLKSANSLGWVDSAPMEIRLAIRSMRA